jgi:uncharacterized membrane protein YhhN
MSVIAAFVIAVVVVAMAAVTVRWADEKLAAAGLTLATAAAFLATPKLLSNSVFRRLQAKWLAHWAALSSSPGWFSRPRTVRASAMS